MNEQTLSNNVRINVFRFYWNPFTFEKEYNKQTIELGKIFFNDWTERHHNVRPRGRDKALRKNRARALAQAASAAAVGEEKKQREPRKLCRLRHTTWAIFFPKELSSRSEDCWHISYHAHQ